MITSAPCQFLQAGAQRRLFRSETTEHQSFPCVEEASLSRTLVFDCGHDYAQKEYAMKRGRDAQCQSTEGHS